MRGEGGGLGKEATPHSNLIVLREREFLHILKQVRRARCEAGGSEGGGGRGSRRILGAARLNGKEGGGGRGHVTGS